MRGVIAVVTTVIVVFIFATMITNGVFEKPSEKEIIQLQEQKMREKANYIVEGIRYVKDSRVGICFAYEERREASTLALTTVPCESIPSDMLAISTVVKH